MDIDANRFLKQIKYIAYFLGHPFKGFWEIKHENEGSVYSAGFLFILLVFSSVCNGIYGGYIFNNNNGVNFDIFNNVVIIMVLFFSFITVNWSLTCLFDGEGSFKDIFVATAYSLIPLIIVNILAIPASNFLSIREAAFYSLLLNLGVFWTGLLLFISTVVTHQYSFFKTVLIMISIILGMCILFYIGLLFINLIGQMVGFIETIILEVSNRA